MDKAITSGAGHKGRSVFIAGRVGDEMEGLMKGFEGYGYEVETASGGDEALQQVQKHKKLAAVILYSSLGGLDPLEICRILKQDKHFIAKPIIVLADKPVDRAAYAAIGIEEVIDPPFSSYKLDLAITEFIKKQKKNPVQPINLRRQVSGVVAAIVVFIAFISYFILVPMFLGAKLK